ncbi:MAG: hypothetical protein SVR94_05475 [Pseudomonadota bacterium]|nr:hypothetical protein [Pseudomonadota bacterium]
MKAIEFNAIIKNKTIKIPDIYTEWSEKSVKVILLREDEATDKPQSLQKVADSAAKTTSNVRKVLALLDAPSFKNAPTGHSETIESIIEANRAAWDD